MTCLLLPNAGASEAPAPLPVPTVTAPEIMPLPANVPASTVTPPVPGGRAALVSDSQRSLAHRRSAGVKIRACQSERARSDLTYGTTRHIPILDCSGKGRARVIGANRQVEVPEVDLAVALQGTDGARGIGLESPIAEDFHRGCAPFAEGSEINNRPPSPPLLPPLTITVAVAVCPLMNWIVPPSAPLAVPPLTVMVADPALELS